MVTTRDAAGLPQGLTASSFCSVSLEPAARARVRRQPPRGPSRDRGVRALRGERARGIAGVGLPPVRGRGHGQVHGDGASYPERAALPLVSGALAHIECRLAAAHPAGDHTIFVGEVRSPRRPNPGGPSSTTRAAIAGWKRATPPRLLARRSAIEYKKRERHAAPERLPEESPQSERREGSHPSMAMRENIEIPEMTWTEVDQAMKDRPVALAPGGSHRSPRPPPPDRHRHRDRHRDGPPRRGQAQGAGDPVADPAPGRLHRGRVRRRVRGHDQPAPRDRDRAAARHLRGRVQEVPRGGPRQHPPGARPSRLR